MRRSDREIKSILELDEILHKGQICRLGMIDDGVPYIVPMCYGYLDGIIYMHCAREGRKIEIIKENPAVCFEIETDVEMVFYADKNEIPDIHFKSIIGYGEIEIVDDFHQKTAAYKIIMGHITGTEEWDIDEAGVNKPLILELEITSLAGKKNQG